MNNRTALCTSLAVALFLAPGISHARWMNPNTGRFQTMDTYEGDEGEPATLHKYIYCGDNPVNMVDPSGEDFELGGLSDGISGLANIASFASPIAAQVQQRARQLGRPSSTRFWAAYPNYNDYSQQEVWRKIGGGVGKQYGTPTPSMPEGLNSCAARVSYGLNYGGAPIPRGAPDAGFNYEEHVYANKPGDKKYYIVKAGKINEYLTKAWGPPDSTPRTTTELNGVKNSLTDEQVGVFATKNTPGHSGVLKRGYTDPYVNQLLPLDVWKLMVP